MKSMGVFIYTLKREVTKMLVFKIIAGIVLGVLIAKVVVKFAEVYVEFLLGEKRL